MVFGTPSKLLRGDKKASGHLSGHTTQWQVPHSLSPRCYFYVELWLLVNTALNCCCVGAPGRMLGPLLMWPLGEETKVKLKTFLSALTWDPAGTHHTKSTSWRCPNHIYSQWGFPNMWRSAYRYWTQKTKLSPWRPHILIVFQAQNYHKACQLRGLTACRKEEVGRCRPSQCRQERTYITRMDWATRICLLNL